MKPKVSIFIPVSLDGFIARKNGDLDWLEDDNAPGGEDYGYREFFESVDVIVMGRKTFAKTLTFGEWPHSGKQVVVLSTGAPAVPEQLRRGITVLALSPKDLVERLAAQGATHLYVDGGVTIQGFIAAGLIDEATITRIPVLIGEGIPLFGTLDKDIRLEHLATRAFANGYVQSKYRFPTMRP